MKFINPNKIYWVSDKNLGIKGFPNSGHRVLIIWFNREKNICRVKTITSLEKKVIDKKTNKEKFIYKLKALNKARVGIIQPVPIKTLNSDHWSAISNESKVISLNCLKYDDKSYRKPKFLIKKKSLY